MASDNLMAMEQPWQFRPSFGDAWFADVLARDTDTLTMALQRSIASTSSEGDGFSSEMVDSLLEKPGVIATLQTQTQTQTPTSTASGGVSENETSTPKRRRNLQPSGRVTKRKSRASKRATTTFITADPANFRQMVQQVTGARFGSLDGQIPVAPVLKPEPRYRGANQLQQVTTGLPTFDTSAFFLDGAASSLILSQALPPPSTAFPDGRAAATGLEFDYSCNFPTLESWKVM